MAEHLEKAAEIGRHLWSTDHFENILIFDKILQISEVFSYLKNFIEGNLVNVS